MQINCRDGKTDIKLLAVEKRAIDRTMDVLSTLAKMSYPHAQVAYDEMAQCFDPITARAERMGQTDDTND
jgi:hypothetical protein